MHAIVWKIRVILLQTFVWIVDLKVREHLTEYFKERYKISPSDYRSTCVKEMLS